MLAGIKTGEIKALILKIKLILKIFDPKIFPRARAEFFFFAAIILVTSSGNDVPMAMANKEIICFGIENSVAISIAE